MPEIISNATPLIAFARISQLSLMREVLGQVAIPSAVAAEISNYAGTVLGHIELADHPWIEVRTLGSRERLQLLLPALDRGEAEVIALALERRSTLVVVDELAGRKVAQSLGLKVIGSVGVLIQAKKLKKIPAVKPLIEAMHDAGIYFSQRFIDTVLERIGED